MVARIRLKPKIEQAEHIGYCKPPKRTRFKPGQSGNPKGRPKGVPNFRTDVQRTLRMPVKINDDGRLRNISTQSASILVLRGKALKGDPKALAHFMDLAARFSTGEQQGFVRELAPNDQAILAAYLLDKIEARNDE
jgi:hypothetical protein